MPSPSPFCLNLQSTTYLVHRHVNRYKNYISSLFFHIASKQAAWSAEVKIPNGTEAVLKHPTSPSSSSLSPFLPLPPPQFSSLFLIIYSFLTTSMKTDSAANYPVFDEKEVSSLTVLCNSSCSVCLSLQKRLSGLRLRTWIAWKALWTNISSWLTSLWIFPMILSSHARYRLQTSMQSSTSRMALGLATCGA